MISIAYTHPVQLAPSVNEEESRGIVLACVHRLDFAVLCKVWTEARCGVLALPTLCSHCRQ